MYPCCLENHQALAVGETTASAREVLGLLHLQLARTLTVLDLHCRPPNLQRLLTGTQEIMWQTLQQAAALWHKWDASLRAMLQRKPAYPRQTH